MPKTSTITIFLIILLVLVGGIYYWNIQSGKLADTGTSTETPTLNENSENAGGSANSEAVSTASDEEKNEQVALVIDFGDGRKEQVELVFTPGMTAFSLLTEGAKQKGLDVQTKTSSAGAYVDSIGGLAGGTDGKYWLYYLNGEQAPTAADKLELKAGDRVDWKFEQPSF